MEDKDIVALYWARSEEAIRATAAKYGAYCRAIIRRLLGDGRDGEECLNDTWLGAWNAMPPHRPARLPPFLGRIARNTALDRYDYNTTQCRGALPGRPAGGCWRSWGSASPARPWRNRWTSAPWGRPSPITWTRCPRRPGGPSSGGTGTATAWRTSPAGTAAQRRR